jgi:hypothetical protein
MYLLPIAANRPPTHNPNLGSVLIGLIQKTQEEMRKATIIPVINLNRINQELNLFIVTIISNLGTVVKLDSISPKEVL